MLLLLNISGAPLCTFSMSMLMAPPARERERERERHGAQHRGELSEKKHTNNTPNKKNCLGLVSFFGVDG